MAQTRKERLGFPLLASLAAGGALSGYLTVRQWLSGSAFAHRTVLITGGSRGLGLVLAREFARLGARVAICGRDEEELERARADLEQRHAKVLAVPCDITDRAQAEAMLDLVENQLGPVEVLVNNAGIIQVGPLDSMTLDDFEQTMATHFWAPLHLTRAALPGMRERRRGHIINITSIGGRISVPHMLPYCASKYALVGLSRGLHAELRHEGIHVTTVTPGLMRTGSPVQAEFDGDAPREYTWFLLGDSLPVASIPAERAARRIIQAAASGRPEVSLSVVPWLAMRAWALAPGLAARVSAGIAAVMPSPPVGPRRERRKGSELQVPRWVERLAALTWRAAERNNELTAAP